MQETAPQHSKDFERQSYSFELPSELIADQALAVRDAARLFVVNRGTRRVEHRWIRELPEILAAAGSYELVANNTRVFRARLLGEREGTGGKVEFFLLKPIAFLEERWIGQGLMKTAARVIPGFKMKFNRGEGAVSGVSTGKPVTAEVIAREETSAGVVLTAVFSENPTALGLGEVPLPPYIVAKRVEVLVAQTAADAGVQSRADACADELKIYNTTFATQDGSVAAPTAGRHFTPALITALRERGIPWHEITLHVGLGTFKPVTTDDVREHTMHAESATISSEVADAIVRAKREGKKILSVGTTTTRTLEGSWVESSRELMVGTHDVNLFIHPGSGHRWNVVDAMLTNFHLPESTLLMMVASFLETGLDSRIGSKRDLLSEDGSAKTSAMAAGDGGKTSRGREWALELYREAICEKYRFYSYGDAMLIL